MADLLYPVPKTAPLQQEEESDMSKMINQIQNMMQMRMQQENYQYQQYIRGLNEEERQKEIQQNNYMYGELSNKFGQDKVKPFQDMGMKPDLAEKQLQTDFTKNFLNQYGNNLDSNTLNQNMDKMSPDVYASLSKSLYNRDYSNNEALLSSYASQNPNLSYNTFLQKAHELGLEPSKEEYIWNNIVQERNRLLTANKKATEKANKPLESEKKPGDYAFIGNVMISNGHGDVVTSGYLRKLTSDLVAEFSRQIKEASPTSMRKQLPASIANNYTIKKSGNMVIFTSKTKDAKGNKVGLILDDTNNLTPKPAYVNPTTGRWEYKYPDGKPVTAPKEVMSSFGNSFKTYYDQDLNQNVKMSNYDFYSKYVDAYDNYKNVIENIYRNMQDTTDIENELR